MSHRLMKHLNGHLLCSIDSETTGTDPQRHDMIQIAVIPLDGLLQPDANRIPFLMDLAPKRPENADPQAMDCNRLRLADLILRGVDADRAADLFVEWFERQNLGFNKRIMPLGANWPFDRDMIVAWLGLKTYEMCFNSQHRDVQSTATFLNDIAEVRGLPFPYPKVNLSYLCNQMRIERTQAHDATDDARVTAEVYRRLLQECIYGASRESSCDLAAGVEPTNPSA